MRRTRAKSVQPAETAGTGRPQTGTRHFSHWRKQPAIVISIFGLLERCSDTTVMETI